MQVVPLSPVEPLLVLKHTLGERLCWI